MSYAGLKYCNSRVLNLSVQDFFLFFSRGTFQEGHAVTLHLYLQLLNQRALSITLCSINRQKVNLNESHWVTRMLCLDYNTAFKVACFLTTGSTQLLECGLCFQMWFWLLVLGLSAESEDEVEELEERVPSPDVAQDDTSAYYDQTPWYGALWIITAILISNVNTHLNEI